MKSSINILLAIMILCSGCKLADVAKDMFGKKQKVDEVIENVNEVVKPDKPDTPDQPQEDTPFSNDELKSCMKHFGLPAGYHARPSTKKLVSVTATRNILSYSIEGGINDWAGSMNHYVILAGKFNGQWCVAPTEHGKRNHMGNAFPECFRQERRNGKRMFQSPMDQIDPKSDDLWIKIIQKGGNGSTNWKKLNRG